MSEQITASDVTSKAASTDLSSSENSTHSDSASSETGKSGLRGYRRIASGTLRIVPTVLAVSVLGGLGYWGHRTEWQMPRFSELSGAATRTPDDWCEEHGVPESLCVNCKPDAFPPHKDYGWCKEHGVHNCPLHHPDVAQVKETPPVTQVDLERADRALKLRPRPENNFACTNPGRRIQFASQEAAKKAGVDVDLVERSPIVESISATGEIRYDETRLARLSSKSAGTVWRVEKQVGDRVRRGEILALIDASEVGRLKAQLLAALAQEKLQHQIHARLVGLADKGIIPGRQLQEAETELSKARTQVVSAQQALINLGLSLSVDDFRGLSERKAAERIRFLGVPRTISERLNAETTTSNLLPVTAPLDGIVVVRNAVAGEVVDSDRELFKIVDTRMMWLMLNVPMEEARFVQPGQWVKFLADDTAEEVGGRISWMSTTADPKTRTVQVRADLSNPDGLLRNETFGLGRIVLREEKEAIVVSNSAIQWDGSCRVVFVRDKAWFGKGTPKIFHTRSVRIGAKTKTHTEIIAGVLPGEVVASEGSNVLRAQLLKNNLGAG